MKWSKVVHIPETRRKDGHTLQTGSSPIAVGDAFSVIFCAATGQPIQINLNGNSGRYIIDGPGSNVWDIGIHKHFNFSEHTRVQLRGELFNAFNHVSYTRPPGYWYYATVSGAGMADALSQRQVHLAIRFEF